MVKYKFLVIVHNLGRLKHVGILLLLTLMGSYPAFAQPTAGMGLLDLRQVDLTQNSSVPLNGDWEFYWEQLLPPEQIDSSRIPRSYKTMPHLWNQDPALSAYGYATYRLRVLLPDDHPDLALSIPDMYTAYRLYLNGKPIARNGKVSDQKESYKPYWLPKTITISAGNTTNLEIVLQISNFSHSKGGIRLPLVLGPEEVLLKERAIELGYVLLLAGSVFVTGLIFLGLYLFGKHEQPILYFGAFCLVFTYRIIGTDLYPFHYLMPEIPWNITVRAEYFSLYFAAAIFGYFVLTLYPKESNRKISYLFIGLFSAFSLAVLVLSPYYFTQLINAFFVLIPFFILYIVWVYVQAALHKREGSGFALASTIAVCFVFIHNLLEYYVIIEENLAITFFGFFSFFFLQALILSYRFTHSLTEARKQAEEAVRIKSQFLSTMSHEIRTPLNAVIGLSELLIESKSENEKKEFAKTIKTSGENLLEIINNILDYSKIESSAIELNRNTVNLEKLVYEVISLLKPLIQAKNLEMKVQLDPDLHPQVWTDSTRLKQILINLIGNSIKFTPEGSITVMIQANNFTDQPGNILFRISDTGLGIPNNKRNRLFKSFSQVETGLTREFGGTGLGLVISQRLVHALRGNIWLDQETKVGSTFYFTIHSEPVILYSGEEEEPASPSKNKNLSDNELRVLLAEDNLINQKVVIKMLEKVQLTPAIATNGAEAVSMHKDQPYDLIFMDMEMPVMDGIEATRAIRELKLSQPESPIIVAMTANAFPEDKERCLEAGMNDFISKPISITNIQAILTKWFQ